MGNIDRSEQAGKREEQQRATQRSDGGSDR